MEGLVITLDIFLLIVLLGMWRVVGQQYESITRLDNEILIAAKQLAKIKGEIVREQELLAQLQQQLHPATTH